MLHLTIAGCDYAKQVWKYWGRCQDFLRAAKCTALAYVSRCYSLEYRNVKQSQAAKGLSVNRHHQLPPTIYDEQQDVFFAAAGGSANVMPLCGTEAGGADEGSLFAMS